MVELNSENWNRRYQNNDTGWDIGFVSTPIKDYIDQLENKSLKILIPGCGNAYEAEYLHKQGFTNVYVIDIAQGALKNLKKRCPHFQEEQLICGDFFDHSNNYDLIIEQTFFCAIDPKLRQGYVKKMKELLKPKGKLVGLLFNAPLNTDRPPFGGDKKEYLRLFKNYFNSVKINDSFNSIPSRQGREFFIMMT